MQETTVVAAPILCQKCHPEVRPTDYYCFNCGNNLKPKPPAVDVLSVITPLTYTVLPPPMGIFRGIKYLRYPDPKLKFLGIAVIVITIVELMLVTVWTINFANQVNQQVNSQLDNMLGF